MIKGVFMRFYKVVPCAILAFVTQLWFIILSSPSTLPQVSSPSDGDPFSGWPHVCGTMGPGQSLAQRRFLLSSLEWMGEPFVGSWRFITETTWGWVFPMAQNRSGTCWRMLNPYLSPLVGDCFHLVICLPSIMTRPSFFKTLCLFSENQIHTSTEIKPNFAFLPSPRSLGLSLCHQSK